MPFLQLTIEASAVTAEQVESACFAAGALSVTFADAADQPIFEPRPGEEPLWQNVTVQALFAVPADRESITAAVAAELGGTLPPHGFTDIEDRAWEREWLKDFKPMRFGRKLWVCPHGSTPPEEDATIVWLDPGLAFGTGTHATTAMCLEWLDSAAVKDTNILDYGCGSGILAIAALKLGARHALGVDLDPQALTASRDNALRNDVANRLDTQLPEAPCPQADILLANILAQPLIELAPFFGTLLPAGGRLALSGILDEQAAGVASAYAPWFDVRPFASRDGWSCLQGTRY